MSSHLEQHLLTTTTRPETVFERGQGSWLFDEQGKAYLDFIQGWAVNGLGHAHPVMQRALAEQSAKLISASPAFYNRPMLELAKRLTELSGMGRAFLMSTGAEANECAVKLARRWGSLYKGGAYEVLTLGNSFHGRSLAMMRASGKPGWQSIFAPMPEGFNNTAQLNDMASVERAISANTVAIMLEPVQGEAGVNLADAQFLRDLRELTRARKLLLIFDEVQAGIGRCGEAFAFQHFGVQPDVLTLAKGIGGGVPLSAMLCQEAFNVFKPGDQGGTYTGNPLMAAVGLAVVNEVCAPAFLTQVRERAAQLSGGLQRLCEKHRLVQARGLGLLQALELPAPKAAAVVQAAMALQPAGLLVNAARPAVLRMMPALNLSELELQQGLALLDEALA